MLFEILEGMQSEIYNNAIFSPLKLYTEKWTISYWLCQLFFVKYYHWLYVVILYEMLYWLLFSNFMLDIVLILTSLNKNNYMGISCNNNYFVFIPEFNTGYILSPILIDLTCSSKEITITTKSTQIYKPKYILNYFLTFIFLRTNRQIC